jgi:hypothetical protein
VLSRRRSSGEGQADDDTSGGDRCGAERRGGEAPAVPVCSPSRGVVQPGCTRFGEQMIE